MPTSRTTTTLSQVPAVCEAVEAWLGNVLARHLRSKGSGVTPATRGCDEGPITMMDMNASKRLAQNGESDSGTASPGFRASQGPDT